ncbi:permease [Candidatus Dojkabacteria bacterium]|nr:permease [Candidatus Dojkabacteria bacterium]
MNKLKKILKQNWILLLLFSSYFVIFIWQNQIDGYLGNESTQKIVGESIYQGWLGLVDYLSAHVLFCLIPAFFIAGAINTLIDSQKIFKYLSGQTKKWLAYLIASVGGFFMEVCSCTILPLFAGIWKKGAGLGIATTFLYAGPAINIVTFILTGQRLGWDLGIVRLILSVLFSILVGLIMEFVFRKEKNVQGDIVFGDEKKISIQGRKRKIFWISLLAILLVGTAPIDSFIKYSVVAVLVFTQVLMTFFWLSKQERKAWWKETIKFTTDIFPLLLIGVFAAGAITHLIPQEKFQKFLGQNTILTNFVAVIFGAIAYFPALVEVPIAENFLKLGMHEGPLMAYLLSDPVLSLQGLLIISKVIGIKKTLIYASSIVVLTTFAGYIFGILY